MQILKFKYQQNNGKQNLEEFYTNKYQRYVTCSCGYKLVCVDDKFSKPFEDLLRSRCCLQLF